MSSEVVSYAVADAVATIAMDQPATRNALSGAVSYTHLTLPTIYSV